MVLSLSPRSGKLAYGAFFCLVVPAALWVWGSHLACPFPAVQAPWLGAAMLIAGGLLMLLAMLRPGMTSLVVALSVGGWIPYSRLALNRLDVLAHDASLVQVRLMGGRDLIHVDIHPEAGLVGDRDRAADDTADGHAAEEAGQDGGHGLRRVAEHQHQLAGPDDLVHEAGETGQHEDQENDPLSSGRAGRLFRLHVSHLVQVLLDRGGPGQNAAWRRFGAGSDEESACGCPSRGQDSN